MIIKRIVETKEVQTYDHRPTIIKWKTQSMIRNHSLRITVQQIIKKSETYDVVKIGLIGNQSTGKTCLSLTLAHLIHKISKVPFSVRVFDKDNLTNFEETLKNLSPANYVLIFDDVSFLGAKITKNQIEKIKQSLTEIRHLEGGQDVKIITILNYHYTLGLDKYLRQSDFKYFTSVGSSEVENMMNIVGKKYYSKIMQFRKIMAKADMFGKFTYKLGKAGFFSYSHRAPFIPLLFYDEVSLRHVVSPLREWIDPICSTCTKFTGDAKFKSEVSVKDFCDESGAKFGESKFKAAVKLKLFTNGINVYARDLVSACRYLDRALAKKSINLEEIATHYNFTITNTKLRKKLDGVLT